MKGRYLSRAVLGLRVPGTFTCAYQLSCIVGILDLVMDDATRMQYSLYNRANAPDSRHGAAGVFCRFHTGLLA